MKRILIYALVLSAALLVPLRGTDVGKLQPVGLIQLYKEGETVVIVTDSGDSGTGSSVQAAFEDLEQTTSGVIFLDTADYLLLSRDAVSGARELEAYLKPSIRVCFAQKNIDPQQAAAYLAVHSPAVKLKDRSDLHDAPELAQENGRLELKYN